MGIASLVIGILSVLGVCVALIPLLNLLNCITLPFAFVGAALGFVDILRPREYGPGRGFGVAGLILNLTALGVGGLRFAISLFTTGGIL